MNIERNEGSPEPKSNFTKLKEGIVKSARSWKEAIQHAWRADKNPHEGRLRASEMPTKYMNIPDDISSLDDKQPPPGESSK